VVSYLYLLALIVCFSDFCIEVAGYVGKITAIFESVSTKFDLVGK